MLNTKEYKHHADLCVRCSYCKFIDQNWIRSCSFLRQCPIDTKYKFNLYSAHGLLHSALAELEGTLEFTPKLMDALWKCTLCGGCDIRCKRNLDIEVLQVIETLRQRCVEQGKGPMPEHKMLADNIRRSHNIYDAPSKDRLKWIPEEVKPALKADIVFFVGCTYSYRQPKLAQATVKLLNKVGTQFMILDDEWCCGYELFATGQAELAREMVDHNIEAIKKSGAKTVITSDAKCYKTLKVDYPKLLEKSTEDMPFTVLHLVEYVDQLMKDGKFQFKNSIPLKVTYHDPCNLARLSEPWFHWEPRYEPPNIAVGKKWRRGDLGVYEPPRNILKRIPGIELVEMERARDNAWCCGSGGGVGSAFPDFALWTAGERIKEARATGAEAIVSCCPHCEEMFNKMTDSKGKGMKVYDVAELMLQAI